MHKYIYIHTYMHIRTYMLIINECMHVLTAHTYVRTSLWVDRKETTDQSHLQEDLRMATRIQLPVRRVTMVRV